MLDERRPVHLPRSLSMLVMVRAVKQRHIPNPNPNPNPNTNQRVRKNKNVPKKRYQYIHNGMKRAPENLSQNRIRKIDSDTNSGPIHCIWEHTFYSISPEQKVVEL